MTAFPKPVPKVIIQAVTSSGERIALSTVELPASGIDSSGVAAFVSCHPALAAFESLMLL